MVGEFSPSESEYKDLQHRVGVSYSPTLPNNDMINQTC